jgi:hypothetical protein
MYVIINIHHDDSWVVPTYAKQDAAIAQITKVWTQIANRFKNYGDYLIFETLNEPRLVGSAEEWSGGTAEGRDVLNKFHLAAVNAIRNTGGNNASRHLMVSPYGANGGSNAIDALVIPNNDSKVIISWHNYSPYNFVQQIPGTNTWGTVAEQSWLNGEFDRLYNKFIKNGRAVVIGEWSPTDKNNTSERAKYADFFIKAAKARQMAPVWWDNGDVNGGDADGGSGIFNRNSLTWAYPTIADAIVNNYSCTPTAITPYLQVNGGSWQQTATQTVASGATIKFGPQPVSGGSWSWSGLASGTSREVTINPTTSGTATATYTNACGAISTQNFVITVTGSQLIPDGTYTMKSASNVYLTATTSGGLLNSSSTENGNYTKWKFVHLGSDVYEISSVQFAGQRLEIPYGTTGNGQKAGITTYTGAGDHLKWKASKVGSTFIFEPMHNLGFALDAYAAQPTIVHLWTKDNTNTNQLYTLINSSGVSLKSGPGIEETQKNDHQNFVIYPNPVIDVLNIQLSGNTSDVSIFNLEGKQLYKLHTGNQKVEIDMSAFKKGMYILKITSKDEGITEKLIKE